MLVIPKMKVSWNQERRKWEVWESYQNGPSVHHSFHSSEAEARRVARAQAKQDAADMARKAS